MKNYNIKHFFKLLTLAVSLSLLSACATQTNKDPLEGINRGIYKFNDVADKAVARPISKAYRAVTPAPIRTGVSNFFGNLGTFVSFWNNLLQFKFSNAFSEAGRFVINSTVGLAGIIDVAAKDKIQPHPATFGQTLSTWGFGQGAYLVLPFLGPSTVTDTAGFVVDTIAFDPISYIGDPATRNITRGVNYLDKRTSLLDASDVLDDAALDPYAFMRDAYLQRRAASTGKAPAFNSEPAGFYDIPEDTKK